MTRVFAAVVGSCCFGLPVGNIVVQFDPASPGGALHWSLLAALLMSSWTIGLLWFTRPWPGYRHALAFAVWVDVATAVAAVTMPSPGARLATTLYLGITGIYIAFLLGPRPLLLHCCFCGLFITAVVAWAVRVDGATLLGLFPFYMPALGWSVALPYGGMTMIDIGRRSIGRTVRSAQHDSLTGLRNRRGMHAAVTSTIRKSAPASVVIAVCDIDGFKAFNDGQGHASGDAALLSLANTLRSIAVTGEITARIGGDEFVLVAFVDDKDDTSILLSRLEPLTHGDVDGVPLTASVGVAWQPIGQSHFSVDDAIRHADEAMYAAKRAGGARCVIYGSVVEQTP